VFVALELLAQSGFGDKVTLKNGKVLENVRTIVTTDSLVVTGTDGITTVYNKREVAEVKKSDKK